MQIMKCREVDLGKTLEGLNQTGIPLVSFHDGSYSPSGYADDLGIYYFIPTLAKFGGLSIEFAIECFFNALLLVGFLISIYCFFSVFKRFSSRLISFIGLFLLTFVVVPLFLDVYVGSFFAIVTTISLFTLYEQKNGKWKWVFPTCFAGIIAGYCNFIRCHSGTGAILFILVYLTIYQKIRIQKKIFLIALLALSIAIPYLHFALLEKQRDAFLTEKDPNYCPIPAVHPKWHSIYIGFGYLTNKYRIEYNDTISFEKAKSVNPNILYHSKEYEKILRNECFYLFRSDPIFILKTVLAKTFKLLIKLILFFNVGLFALFYVKPSFRFFAPFIVSGLFYALPGILTMPATAYVSGMVSLATLLALILIGLAIEKFKASEVSKQIVWMKLLR